MSRTSSLPVLEGNSGQSDISPTSSLSRASSATDLNEVALQRRSQRKKKRTRRFLDEQSFPNLQIQKDAKFHPRASASAQVPPIVALSRCTVSIPPPERLLAYSLSSLTSPLSNALETHSSLQFLSSNVKKLILSLLNEIEKEHINRLKNAQGNIQSATPLLDQAVQTAFSTEECFPTQDQSIQTTLESDEPSSLLTTEKATVDLTPVMNKLEDLQAQICVLQQSTPSPPQAAQVSSYAQVLKTQPKSTLVLRPKEGTEIRTVASSLTTLPCPREVNITKFKVLNDRIEVRCQSAHEKDRLKDFLAEAPVQDLTIQEKSPTLVKAIIFNLPASLTEQQLQDTLQARGINTNSLNVVQQQASRLLDKEHWIIELIRSEALKLLEQRFLFLGFSKFRVSRYVKIIRCGKCQLFNRHPTTRCTNASYCSYCGGEHDRDDCTADSPKCINCTEENRSLMSKNKDKTPVQLYPTSHPADHHTCPIYREVLEKKLKAKF